MLDYKIEAFLTLCDTMSYTKTAQKLNMTQPAVTNQIKALERYYGCLLFEYSGRSLKKTEKCRMLEEFSRSMRSNASNIYEAMSGANTAISSLNIGATKTIGEYVITDLIKKYLEDENNRLSLTVDNTHQLLEMLENGSIDFALVEGFFDKNRYDYRLFRSEEFVGFCAPEHPFAGKEVNISDIFSENIIIREKGSGTRDILEGLLHDYGYTPENFAKETVISNFSVIKELVSSGLGISFAYKAINRENDKLSCFTIKGEKLIREFNIVSLKRQIPIKNIEKFLGA